MNLDEAIQKFAAYARHEGDFDELDLKEVIYAEVAERERVARIDENDSWMEWIDNCRVTYDNPEHDGEKASAELHNLFTSRIVQLTKAKEATK